MYISLLKGIVLPKSHHLLMVMTYFILWNTKEDILINCFYESQCSPKTKTFFKMI